MRTPWRPTTCPAAWAPSSGREGERDEGEAGHQRVRAEHVLEVERAEQEEAEDRAGRDEHQEQAAADGAVGDPLDPQERLLCVALPGCEGAESDEAERCEPDRLGRAPAGLICLGDRVDERGEAGGAEQGAGYVEATPARLLDIAGMTFRAAAASADRDGDVDVEDEAPVADLGEDAADEDADRCAGAADRTPGCERLGPLLALEGSRDDRQGGRGEHGGSEALAGPCCEQCRGGACEGGGDRRDGENSEAGQEHAPAADEVGEPAAEEEQAAEDERVARDRPADRRPTQLQIAGEARQGDVHGSDVENHHQLGHEQDAEENSTASAGGATWPRWVDVRGGGLRSSSVVVVVVLSSVMHGLDSLQDGGGCVAVCGHFRLLLGGFRV